MYETQAMNRIAGYICGVQISFFLFSVYQNENLTNETYVTMGVFSCVKYIDRTKIEHVNQLEIARNEIWTPRKFHTIRYTSNIKSLQEAHSACFAG